MFNADLVDDLARERVVLFVGAGVSASASTVRGGKIADWAGFLHQTAEKLNLSEREQVFGLLREKDYLLASEILQKSLSESWAEAVADEFGQKAMPSELHNAIINLQQRIILTTNFDKLLENAWELMDARATHYPILVTDLDSGAFKALKDHSRRYLIKIHGTVDNANSMVFTRSEYIRSAFGNARYSLFIESLLLNYTFIFVGFSMNDPAVMSLMEMYALRYPTARPHYIFSPQPVADNIIEINKRLRKLSYILYNPADGHKELTGKLNELSELAHDRRRELLARSIS